MWKIPPKSAIKRELLLSLLPPLVIRPTEASILGAQGKNSSQLQGSKKKNLEAKTANCSGFMLNRQGTEQEVVQSMLETTVLY